MISLRIVKVLVALLCTLCASTAIAGPWARVVRQAAGEQVTLTVTSTCGPASVRVKKGLVLTTPFTVTFPRGKAIQLKAMDHSLTQCGALAIVSAFSHFVVNQLAMPLGQRTISVTLDQDAAVHVQYAPAARDPVTLSVSANCTRGANILVSETTINGQTGTLRTHFDAHFLSGQTVRLEAPSSLAACSDLGVVIFFANWSAAGKVYPQGQTSIELTLDKFISAYASYTGVFPTLRINTYQLRHKGEPVDYILLGMDVSEFTVHLSGEPLPPEITVFVNGQQAQILSRPSPTEIEIRLPTLKADAPGYFFVRVTLPDSRFSNAVPIEIRNQ